MIGCKVCVDLNKLFGRKILDPSGIINGLSNHVPRRFVLLQFNNNDGACGIDSQQINVFPKIGVYLAANQQPVITEDGDILCDLILKQILALQLHRSQCLGLASDLPDSVSDCHQWSSSVSSCPGAQPTVGSATRAMAIPRTAFA